MGDGKDTPAGARTGDGRAKPPDARQVADDIIRQDVAKSANGRPGKSTPTKRGVSIGSRTLSKPVLVGGAVAVLAIAGAGIGLGVGGGGSSKPAAAVVPQSSTSSGQSGTTAAPVLTPVHAVFTQSKFSTVYTESATGSGLTYTWAVHIPADPNCAQGFKPETPSPNDATWFHADVSQGGPCNHSGHDYLESIGHPGLVAVLVTNKDWSCSATYEGTLTGSGNAPEACTARKQESSSSTGTSSTGGQTAGQFLASDTGKFVSFAGPPGCKTTYQIHFSGAGAPSSGAAVFAATGPGIPSQFSKPWSSDGSTFELSFPLSSSPRKWTVQLASVDGATSLRRPSATAHAS